MEHWDTEHWASRIPGARPRPGLGTPLTMVTAHMRCSVTNQRPVSPLGGQSEASMGCGLLTHPVESLIPSPRASDHPQCPHHLLTSDIIVWGWKMAQPYYEDSFFPLSESFPHVLSSHNLSLTVWYIFFPFIHISFSLEQKKCNTNTNLFSQCLMRIWLMCVSMVRYYDWSRAQMERNVNLEDWNAATSQTQVWDGARMKNTMIGISNCWLNFSKVKWMNECCPGSNPVYFHTRQLLLFSLTSCTDFLHCQDHCWSLLR